MKRVFVTGTDTNIGKTLVSAWLVRSWNAAYWKPVQTGQDKDARTIAHLAPNARIFPSSYELAAPLSPQEAARREGVAIDLSRITLPDETGPLVVEGAGGALVPLTDATLTAELILQLGLPAVVVARTALGTINHTILTVEALLHRRVRVAGIITSGVPDPANRAAIEQHTGVRVVGELPLLPDPVSLEGLAPLDWHP